MKFFGCYAAYIIFIFSLISCASVAPLRKIPEEDKEWLIESPVLDELPSDVLQEGRLLFGEVKYLEPSDILVDLWRKWTLDERGGLRYANVSNSKLFVEYKGERHKVKLTYDYARNKDDDSMYPKNTGVFEQMKIKKLPKRYNFDVIAPEPLFLRLIHWDISSLESNDVSRDMLPAKFSGFSVDEKRYTVRLTKLRIVNPDYTNATDEFLLSQQVSLRSMIREDTQIFLITDESDKICASFDKIGYKIYDKDGVNADDLALAIGVYSGIFELLNRY